MERQEFNLMFQKTRHGRYKKRNWIILKDESRRLKKLVVGGSKDSKWTLQKASVVALKSERFQNQK